MNTDKPKKGRNKDRSRVHPDYNGQNNDSFEHDSTNEKQNNRNTLSKFQSSVRKSLIEKNAISVIANVKKGATKWRSYTTSRRQFDYDGEHGLNRKRTGGLGLEYDATKADRDATDGNLNSTEQQLMRAHNRNLIEYFARLSQSTDMDECVNLDYIESLLSNGANVNCTDKYGQTILHEVARAWHTDVAKFLVDHGANVNQGDCYGRTPLHVAAAVDYPEMVTFLIDAGANKECRTEGELQTPVHFAARNDACNSLRVLVKTGCEYKEVVDYKGRTPLHVAAELDRSETARLLLELDDPAPAGTTDYCGESVLVWMINKMPPVANLALDQFHTTDRANRRQHYHLQNLEPKKPDDPRPGYPQSALRMCVRQNRYDLIEHDVFLCLIKIKWKHFARQQAIFGVVLNLVFNILWSVQGILIEYDQRHLYILPNQWWRIFLFIVAILITIYQVVEEFREYHSSKKAHKLWRDWREKELEKDKVYAHPRWPEEMAYLEQEDGDLDKLRPQYFNDFWNIYDWVCYLFLLIVIITHLVDVIHHTNFMARLHIRIMAITIILLWLRLMKSTRAFSLLGPFIVMIGHMLRDFVKFVFLYMVFFIPYACAFWMLFGENKVPEQYQGLPGSSNYTVTVDGLSTADALLFTLFRMTLVDDYDYDGMKSVDYIMTYVLIGSWLAISAVLMLNMLIALLSDTFQRVHDNARANALMQKAIFILNVEESMNVKTKNRFRKYIHEKCSPLSRFYDDDAAGSGGGDELKKVTFQIKDRVAQIQEMLNTRGIDQNEQQDELEELANHLKASDQYMRENLNDDNEDVDKNQDKPCPVPSSQNNGQRKLVTTKKFEYEIDLLRGDMHAIQKQQRLMINHFKDEMNSVKKLLHKLLNQQSLSQDLMSQSGTGTSQQSIIGMTVGPSSIPQSGVIQQMRSSLVRSTSLSVQQRPTMPVTQDPEWIQSEQRRKEELEALRRQLHQQASSSGGLGRLAARPSLTPLNTADSQGPRSNVTEC